MSAGLRSAGTRVESGVLPHMMVPALRVGPPCFLDRFLFILSLYAHLLLPFPLTNAHRVDKDVMRTDRHLEFFEGDDNPNLVILNDVLMTFCMYNVDLGTPACCTSRFAG